MHADEHEVATDVVGRLVRDAAIEVIPLRGAAEKLVALAPNTTVTVTCSPRFGLEATLALAQAAVATGHCVVPHLAARQFAGPAELHDMVGRLVGLGIEHIYVIGGDAPEPAGEFASAGDLLDALVRDGLGFASVGVGCYPEGHPKISDEVLVEELLRKQEHADYMVSQLCFDADALVAWLRRMRATGVRLPLRVGVAAPLKTRKLVEMSLRIGVGTSLRFLTKQRGVVGHMLGGETYRPEHLLHDIGDGLLSSDELGITGLHLFSFNQVAETVAWQRRTLEARALGDRSSCPTLVGHDGSKRGTSEGECSGIEQESDIPAGRARRGG